MALPIVVLLVISLLIQVAAQAADVTTGKNPDTGLRYWQWQSGDLLLKLTQRTPDQTRAFFMARGFTAEQANLIATNCAFQSMMKNTGSNSVIALDLNQWTVKHNNQQYSLRTREVWKPVWKKQKADPAAQIAFEWALLPTHQTYNTDDYNWGLSSYGLPPGSLFDLGFNWQRNGKTLHGQIKNIQCPADNPQESDK